MLPLQHGSFSTKLLFVCIYRVHVIGHFARTLTGKLSRSSTSPQQCERRLHWGLASSRHSILFAFMPKITAIFLVATRLAKKSRPPLAFAKRITFFSRLPFCGDKQRQAKVKLKHLLIPFYDEKCTWITQKINHWESENLFRFMVLWIMSSLYSNDKEGTKVELWSHKYS